MSRTFSLLALGVSVASALRSHPLVSTVVTFPRFEVVDEFVVGVPVSVVVGFINGADRPVNVTRIAGTAVDAVTGVVLQNLSSVIGEFSVESGAESAFEFIYTPTSPETTMAQAGVSLLRACLHWLLLKFLLAGRTRRLLPREARALRDSVLQRHRDSCSEGHGIRWYVPQYPPLLPAATS